MDEIDRALERADALARRYLAGLQERHVGARVGADAIVAALGGTLPDDGEDGAAVIEDMVRAVDAGLVASAGPRYFGFVIGGAMPASMAADWLAAAWDQNAALHASSPAAAAVEQVAGRWLLDLLGLPDDASVGFPPGTGVGNTIALAAARHALLERLGWDVERHGLYGAPEISVVVGEQAHATLETALQLLGLGRDRVTRVTTDDQGRMLAEGVASALAAAGPATIVCTQAGNVNSGAFDPIDAIADLLVGREGTWLHVDGAFGLWAAASPRYRHLVAGLERADSWATDAHKWLNVGYDCGFVATRDPEAHRASMSTRAAYLLHDPERRDNWEWTLESSRRARGFALYATLRSLGRSGVVELVDRCCQLASELASGLRGQPGIEILNDVVLDQVLVGFEAPDGVDRDAFTDAVIRRVQEEGVAWMGGTTWAGRRAMRVSVSNWMTTSADIVATVAAILRARSAEAKAR